jgi:hypothetical protein
VAKFGRVAEMGIFRATKTFFRDSEAHVAQAAEPKVLKTSIPRKYKRELTLAGAPGREAMETINKHGVTTVFREGGGSMFDRTKNTIFIDVKNGSPTAGLVHEATHVRWTKEGWTADVTRLDRTSYINRTLDEETDAAVNEIRAIMELKKQGVQVQDSSLQGHYLHGYDNAVKWSEATGRTQGRPLTYAELDQAGQLGGRGAVNAAFHSGHIRTSTNGLPYPQFYGEGWDAYQAWYRQYGQQI